MECKVIGEMRASEEVCLLSQDDNLLEDSYYDEQGFGVDLLFNTEEHTYLKDELEQLVKNRLSNFTSKSLDGFQLERYHEFITDEEHLIFMSSIKSCIDIQEFPLDKDSIPIRIGEIINQKLGLSCEGMDDREFFCLRLVRPQKHQDCNPPHKDIYIDRLRNAVNLYIPICGSDEHSSLSLIEGSHKWLESETEVSENGVEVNGVKYSVPAICGTKNDFNLSRPNPKVGEVLFFSPYLIHGAGYNFNNDITRVSLEMRLWKS
ncbi:MAG: hypothetical protein COA58_00275 [Bacteroidetes bacterium]|nr:MAG: hypothetical protein COA58_00275 [Bacteroidota bacterium]